LHFVGNSTSESATLDKLAAVVAAGAMGLPVSGFPNMNAVSLEDATGQNYIDTVDFLKVGVLGSVMAYAIIISIGYVLMLAVGF
jgi:di/tricarboxylate transporter